jgi:hypothetical protein
MTWCPKGDHGFPVEDEYGAYCPQHGISLVWHAAHDPEQPTHPFLAGLAERHHEQPCAK